MGIVESFDGFAGLRNGLRDIAARRGDWAGIPMPLDGQKLVIEANYPMATELAEIGAPKEEPLPPDVTIRNRWWSRRERCEIYIWNEGGKVEWGRVPGFNHLGFDLTTLGCATAWGIEQESNALALLGTLVRHHQMKQYLLTGMFLESSMRSGLTYLFRRLKPTVVLDARNKTEAETRILCTLCLHPIAYYAGSWAGAMAPTDDVVAHLMLMRGDEPMFWRRANQCAPDRPEAGL